MIRVPLKELVSSLRRLSKRPNLTIMEIHRETEINRNMLHGLATHPTALVKVKDLDSLLQFFFSKMCQSGYFSGDSQELARLLTASAIRWYPNDEQVLLAVGQQPQGRSDCLGAIDEMDEKAFSDAFWSEYRRIHKPSGSRFQNYTG